MSVKITVDTSGWDKIKKNLLQANKESLKIGWFENSRYGPENDNLPVAQVAQWNEESSINNPTRPFIRFGFMPKLEGPEYRKIFEASIANVLQGNTTFKAEYNKLGPILVKEMKEVITDWDTPPNSPRTIEAKGFDDPLVWTGRMRESVEYKVERGDE